MENQKTKRNCISNQETTINYWHFTNCYYTVWLASQGDVSLDAN